MPRPKKTKKRKHAKNKNKNGGMFTRRNIFTKLPLGSMTTSLGRITSTKSNPISNVNPPPIPSITPRNFPPKIDLSIPNLYIDAGEAVNVLTKNNQTTITLQNGLKIKYTSPSEKQKFSSALKSKLEQDWQNFFTQENIVGITSTLLKKLIYYMGLLLFLCLVNKNDCVSSIKKYVIKDEQLASSISDSVKEFISKQHVSYDETTNIIDVNGVPIFIFEQDSVDAIKEE
jgi:hypothetical protein